MYARIRLAFTKSDKISTSAELFCTPAELETRCYWAISEA